MRTLVQQIYIEKERLRETQQRFHTNLQWESLVSWEQGRGRVNPIDEALDFIETNLGEIISVDPTRLDRTLKGKSLGLGPEAYSESPTQAANDLLSYAATMVSVMKDGRRLPPEVDLHWAQGNRTLPPHAARIRNLRKAIREGETSQTYDTWRRQYRRDGREIADGTDALESLVSHPKRLSERLGRVYNCLDSGLKHSPPDPFQEAAKILHCEPTYDGIMDRLAALERDADRIISGRKGQAQKQAKSLTERLERYRDGTERLYEARVGNSEQARTLIEKAMQKDETPTLFNPGITPADEKYTNILQAIETVQRIEQQLHGVEQFIDRYRRAIGALHTPNFTNPRLDTSAESLTTAAEALIPELATNYRRAAVYFKTALHTAGARVQAVMPELEDAYIQACQRLTTISASYITRRPLRDTSELKQMRTQLGDHIQQVRVAEIYPFAGDPEKRPVFSPHALKATYDTLETAERELDALQENPDFQEVRRFGEAVAHARTEARYAIRYAKQPILNAEEIRDGFKPTEDQWKYAKMVDSKDPLVRPLFEQFRNGPTLPTDLLRELTQLRAKLNDPFGYSHRPFDSRFI